MMSRHVRRFGVAAALGASSVAASAQDRADIDRTQIIGNRELPKVLYFVPWKKPLTDPLAGTTTGPSHVSCWSLISGSDETAPDVVPGRYANPSGRRFDTDVSDFGAPFGFVTVTV